jgi:hypothetical protein
MLAAGAVWWAFGVWQAYRQVASDVTALGQPRPGDIATLAERAKAVEAPLRELDQRLAPLTLVQVWPVVGPVARAVRRDVSGAVSLAEGVAWFSRWARAEQARPDPPLTALLTLLGPGFGKAASDVRQGVALLAGPAPAWPPFFAEAQSRAWALRPWANLLGAVAVARGPLLAALGARAPARYLIVFQDGGELRATGGFIAAWSLVTVRGGRIGRVVVHGVHGLAGRARWALPAPYAFRSVFHYRRLAFFDANVSPNGPTTGARLARYFESVPGSPPLVGVVFVDTWLLQRVLSVLGPVPVALPSLASPVLVTASNTEQQLAQLAEGPSAATPRKQFLTPLVATLRARAAKANGERRHALAEVLLTALDEGHLWFWTPNQSLEGLIQRLGWGAVLPAPVGRNFVDVVDENLGGHKDNTYLRQQLNITAVSPSRSGMREEIRVTLALQARATGFLIVPYQGWLRWYLPLGTRILAVRGAAGGVVWQDVPRHATVLGVPVHVPAPGSTTVSVWVELPSSVAPWPLVVGEQPGLGGQALTVRSAAATLKAAPASTVTVLRRGSRLALKTGGLGVVANLLTLYR